MPLRLVIGAGTTEQHSANPEYEGWLITDVGVLDALRSEDWTYFFGEGGCIDTVLAEHVIEHWTEEQFKRFLGIVRKFLSTKGFLRLAVPDGFHPDPAYIDAVKPGGTGPGSQDHKVLYNHVILERLLRAANWRYELLEYFDEAGHFNRVSWDAADGMIKRSERYDPRNSIDTLGYTSLIVDVFAQGIQKDNHIFEPV
jgi:predicted SAM-dependent methyltransferase